MRKTDWNIHISYFHTDTDLMQPMQKLLFYKHDKEAGTTIQSFSRPDCSYGMYCWH